MATRKRSRPDPVVEEMISLSSYEHRECIQQGERQHKESMALQQEMMRQIRENLSANRRMILQGLEFNCRTLSSSMTVLEKLSYIITHQFRNSGTAPNIQDVPKVDEPVLSEVVPNTPPGRQTLAQARSRNSVPTTFDMQCQEAAHPDQSASVVPTTESISHSTVNCRPLDQ